MELVIDAINDTYKFYEHCLTFSDPRVEDWLFMQSPLPTIGICLLYLLMVWLGPKIMANREPFKMQYVMVAYNLSCVLLSIHIVKECIYCGYKAGYSLSCTSVRYSYDEYEHRIAKALWWFYFSKCFEMLDTAIFILRKKNQQLSFLHVYHHVSMFLLWWIGIKWVAGGQAVFGAALNSFIHMVMYTYYALSAMGPSLYKYLWWKKYLTQLQFAQFVIGMIHAVQSIYVQCDFPMWMQYGLLVYAATITSLFTNFYIQAYIKRKRPPKSELLKQNNNPAKPYMNGVNGHAVHAHNGVQNGSVETKKDN